MSSSVTIASYPLSKSAFSSVFTSFDISTVTVKVVSVIVAATPV